MIGALFNASLYILLLIKPTKINHIANYFFGVFVAAETREVIYIGLLAIHNILILLSIVPAIKLVQSRQLKSPPLGLNVQQVMFLILTLASIITAVAIAYPGIIGFIGMIVPQLIRRYYWRFTLGIQMIL
ncbi:iron chelate uptake ABC transporter family permease subunit, partial [Staphylococcus haemolyticus]|uniref:iron chelate uptake ABC transporter family permease subunit n=1 Tax=Staphylococcus haemolyticus TaxID=1283 RepID=UPI000AD9A9F5